MEEASLFYFQNNLLRITVAEEVCPLAEDVCVVVGIVTHAAKPSGIPNDMPSGIPNDTQRYPAIPQRRRHTQPQFTPLFLLEK